MTTQPDMNDPLMKALMAHVAAEERGNVNSVLATFGERAEFHDMPWNGHYVGRDEVRSYYSEALQAFADAKGELRRIHLAGNAITLEVTMVGTHTGDWHGVKATGMPVRFPLCAVFVFDAKGLLESETVYYYRPTVMKQLGVRPL